MKHTFTQKDLAQEYFCQDGTLEVIPGIGPKGYTLNFLQPADCVWQWHTSAQHMLNACLIDEHQRLENTDCVKSVWH